MRHEAKQCLVKVKRDFVFYVRSQHMVGAAQLAVIVYDCCFIVVVVVVYL